jgi:superfamily II DNA or RNA helicase
VHIGYFAVIESLQTDNAMSSPELADSADNPLQLDRDVERDLDLALMRTPRMLVERALDYIHSFSDLNWHAARNRWIANVRGTHWYGVSLTRDGEADCSCPAFRDHENCKHVTALRIVLMGECTELGKPRLTSTAPAPAKLSAPVHQALSSLRAIGAKLSQPAPAQDDERKQVVFVLELKGTRRVQRFELVPRPRSRSKTSGWRLDAGTDLRRSQGSRLRFAPPKYLSQQDTDLILALGDAPGTTYGSASPRTLGAHLLLAMAADTERLMDSQARLLRLHENLWSLHSRLEMLEDIGRFSFSMEPLDRSCPAIPLAGDWKLVGEEGNWTILTDLVLHRLDPRTPLAVVQLAEELPDLPLDALSQVRTELQLLARAGVEMPTQFLPPRLHESPLRQVALELRDDGVTLRYLIAYPSLDVPFLEPRSLLAFTHPDGTLAELKRDKDAEAALFEEMAAKLVEHGIEFLPTDSGWTIVAPTSLRRLALHLIPHLQESGWTVREANTANRWKRRTGTFKASSRTSGQDWFELAGVIDYEGFEVPLSTLVTHKGDFLLPDGSVGELSQALLRRLQWIGRLGESTADGFRLRGAHAVLAQDLLESGHTQVRDLAQWNTHLQAILHTHVSEVAIPASLAATLRPYQIEGLQWLVSLREQGIGGILADDMGLGKTVQVIAHLCRLYEHDPSLPPTLVVGPASVAGNWISELARFAPHLQTRLLHGLDRDTLRDAPVTGPTVFVTTYGTLPRELDWARGREFSLLVLDESQAIRNPATVTHRACLELRATQKLCLTGTPIENSLSDLWAQFSFLNPGLLGPREVFLQQFTPDPGDSPDLSRLRLLTAPFWLRRTKERVAADLPARQDIVLNVEMDSRQAALYERQLKEYQKHLLPHVRTSGLEGGRRFQVLTALLRLRQVACAPELAGHRGPSAKLDLLMEKLVEDLAEGHKALVFSSFTSLLDLVDARLWNAHMEFLRLDGSTPAAQRTRLIERFQETTGPAIFLVSLKAGGAGINLTAADYVFLLDPWWNPAIEEQAAARAHRIGQERPVTVYRMVAKGTIEERVLALSRSKAALASQLFDTDESGGTALTPELVQELLG